MKLQASKVTIQKTKLSWLKHIYCVIGAPPTTTRNIAQGSSTLLLVYTNTQQLPAIFLAQRYLHVMQSQRRDESCSSARLSYFEGP